MIEIVEFQASMAQGMTKPWLCIGDDGKKYVVKRLNAGFKGCIYEWIASKLGQQFGLNIPETHLVRIDPLLIADRYDLQSELGAGVAFASAFQSSLNEVTFHQLKIADPHILLDLFIFDYWIKNDDRTLTQLGGNPNLYQSQSTRELVVFDHNLAFDENFDLAGFKKTHVAHFLLANNAISPDDYLPKLKKSFQLLPEIIEGLPNDWLDELESSARVLNELQLLLLQFERDDFWEAII